MSLLQQIQESVIQEGSDLGSILLKVRLLAARLGSDLLEEWVKFESEGYPTGSEVPSYRVTGVTYRGTFTGAFGASISNAQIPSYIIEQHAGLSWTEYEIRESIAAVDEMVKNSRDGGSFGIDASNLILQLQGKVYQGYGCNDVSATISPAALYEIQQTVRSRILELTIELEKSVPEAKDITFGKSVENHEEKDQIQQISQQIIYGNVSTAVTGGAGASISIEVNERDNASLIESLVHEGIPKADASELAQIMEAEQPSSPEEPFGTKAKSWIANNLSKAAEGTWGVGISVATKVLTEAAMKYYGLK